MLVVIELIHMTILAFISYILTIYYKYQTIHTSKSLQKSNINRTSILKILVKLIYITLQLAQFKNNIYVLI